MQSNILFAVIMATVVISSSSDIATYEEIKDLPNHPEILLVDVRETQELIDTGIIPTSINVPLAEVNLAFSEETTSKNFKNKYGKEKPNNQTPIIVTCRSGRRSKLGVEKLKNLGYENVRNYKGSWLEWAQREGI